jgi:16S rRNA (cytidine1402-2'-O)-methyltransferase
MTETTEPTGALFVVSTPIGNMADITRRAIDVLGVVDVIACEDTRRTGRLLSMLGIAAPKLRRLDAHTEASRTGELIERLLSGQRVAVVSDAGTPGVSDPGSRLVAACVDAGIRVVPIPGPSAALAAVVASGLPTDQFAVLGFLPRKGQARAAALHAIATRSMTSVVYESPNRTASTLADLSAVCGADRLACVARELTKLHEEIVRSSLGELARQMSGDLKGEVVIVVAPAPPQPDATDEELLATLIVAAQSGSSRRSAVESVVVTSGSAKRRVYDLALTVEFAADGR